MHADRLKRYEELFFPFLTVFVASVSNKKSKFSGSWVEVGMKSYLVSFVESSGKGAIPTRDAGTDFRELKESALGSRG